jgi:WD40 repeat protein
MRRHILVTAVTAAAATLTALVPAPAAPAGAAARATRAAPGAQLWVARYNGPASKQDGAGSMAVSPDGSTVFVTGSSDGGPMTGDDYATAAYNAATGRQLWVSRYNGPGNGERAQDRADAARSVAVSPGGGKVFVTGSSKGRGSGYDYATVAYSAATGRQLWVRRYNGPGNGTDVAFSVAVSPGGRRVFVAGDSYGATTGYDYATVAYSTATGRQLWVRRYNGPANGTDVALSVAMSPAGTSVFVTGISADPGGANSPADYATVAYSTATGGQLWVRRYNGSPARRNVNGASWVAVSPAGARVFVTGHSYVRATADDYATVAYIAATGKRLWVRRYNGPANSIDGALSVAVSPGGGRVFVTGYSYDRTGTEDYATVGYSAAGGRQLWVRRYNGPVNGDSAARSVAVSPAGTTVYVTGYSYDRTGIEDYATVGYSAAAGRRLWVSRYNGTANLRDIACCVAVSPAETTVFVTGSSYGVTTGTDYATVAYRG